MIIVKKIFFTFFLLALVFQQGLFGMTSQYSECNYQCKECEFVLDDDQEIVSAYMVDIFRLIEDTSVLLELYEPQIAYKTDEHSNQLVINLTENHLIAQKLSQDAFEKILISRQNCKQLNINSLKQILIKKADGSIAQFQPDQNDLLAEMNLEADSYNNSKTWFVSLAQIIYEKATFEDGYAFIPNIIVQVGYDTVTIYQDKMKSKINIKNLEGYAQKLLRYPAWNKNLVVSNSLCCAGSTTLCPVAYLCFIPAIVLTVLFFLTAIAHH